MWVLPLLTIVFLVAIPLFIWDATNAILNSTDGDFSEIVVDPTQPGYESYVIATPAHLTLGVDESGNLSLVAIISLGPNDLGGSLLLLNPKTDIKQGETITSIFESGNVKEVEKSLMEFLSIGFTTTNLMTSSNWDAYTASASPLSVVLDDPLHEEILAGQFFSFESTCCPYEVTTSVESSDVGNFLSWADPAGSGSLRLLRQEGFWQEWIEKLSAEVNVSAVPGEVDAGFGRMVWGLSRGEMVIVQISQSSTPEATFVDESVIRDVVLEMVPFPMPSSPEARTTVRLLDAVGGLDLAGDYSAGLVREGAQILIIGNASEFTGETELIYHDADNSETVETFKEILGGGVIYYEPLTDSAVEITVIIGKDLVAGN